MKPALCFSSYVKQVLLIFNAVSHLFDYIAIACAMYN